MLRLLLVAAYFFQTSFAQSHGNCPPKTFDSLYDFDFVNYFSGRWHSLKQKEVMFQDKRSFYCVTADYLPQKSGLFLRPRVLVYNFGRFGSTKGKKNSILLRAMIPNQFAKPAQAYVGLSFFPLWLFNIFDQANYWIAAAGKYKDLELPANATVPEPSGKVHDWAIITAGPPDQEGPSGFCSSKTGLWMFSRNPLPGDAVIAVLEQKAKDLELDVTTWKPVDHKNCIYPKFPGE